MTIKSNPHHARRKTKMGKEITLYKMIVFTKISEKSALDMIEDYFITHESTRYEACAALCFHPNSFNWLIGELIERGKLVMTRKGKDSMTGKNAKFYTHAKNCPGALNRGWYGDLFSCVKIVVPG